MARFASILVANRGEIALRVMRTAKALGYRTIGVHSEADAAAPHVRFADDAVCIGPPPVGESYLSIDKILAAAQSTGAEAIHPGYGFLSENAAFAAACRDAGIVFIGPSPRAIELMGNKAAAKRHMIQAGVSCVPGYEGRGQSDATLLAAAKAVGFPIMVKAAAGGGGRGMRLVESEGDLPVAIQTARAEARNAFGSDELILEKAIVRPRHVEVQVLGDSHGNIVYLGERDCSVQRRHQKVVEEAPCPVMTAPLRAEMGGRAVEAARSIGYENAGTVEFLLDASGVFYFLEMNTRLQVEHPVTELVTGLDLVALQIAVAQGEPLGFGQDDVRLNGHAIEVRLYAEDPAQDFLPMTGHVDLWQPATGDGLRIDSGLASIADISPYYDPMIAKVIAWGPSREVATNRLVDGLRRTRLFGTPTNKGFLIDVLGRPRFRNGEATTAFIAEEFAKTDLANPALSGGDAAMAAVLQHQAGRRAAYARSLGIQEELLDWSSIGPLESHFRYRDGDRTLDVTVSAHGRSRYEARVGEDRVAVEIVSNDGVNATLAVDGRRVDIGYFVPAEGLLHLDVAGRVRNLRNELAFAGGGEEAGGGGRIVAPMHGALLELLVAIGDRVEKGARLAVLESMKMHHAIVASVAGRVKEVNAKPGTQVAAGDVLLVIEPDAESAG
jgi:geranyl-CoA carboxylase alpha subunit